MNWKDWFYFTRRESNGIRVLLLLIVLLLLLPMLYKRIFSHNDQQLAEFAAKVKMFQQSLTQNNITDNNTNTNTYLKRYDTLTLFKFNPNTTTNEQWKQLGLTDKQIQIINNYRNKGGKFYDRADFEQIYGISNEQHALLATYVDLPDNNEPHNEVVHDKNEPTPPTDAALFNFDPNTTTTQQWQQLGLTDKQIQSVQNYVAKGGKFRQKEDLQKIYNIGADVYLRLEPYIVINTTDNKQTTSKNTDITVEINSADTTQLQLLRGIGAYYAAKIVAYRNQLGGFVRKEQLLEIKGFKNDMLQKIAPQITLDLASVRQIRINFTTIADMIKHPYIEYHQAKSIADFRDKHGAFTSLQQLLDNKLLTQTSFEKLQPYLTIK